MPRKHYVAQKRTDRNSVGKTVKRLRTQQNLTQEDLAGRAAVAGWSISRDVVKRIERENARSRTSSFAFWPHR
jgi:transcriptional regulator with XRE-family HTH domain